MQAGLKEDSTPRDVRQTTKSARAMEEEASKLRLMAGSFVDGRLLAAFQILGKVSGVTEKSSVAQRCWEILDFMRPFVQVIAQTASPVTFIAQPAPKS